MIHSRRRLSTIIDNVIKNLAINYRKEFDQLKNNNINENSMDRIQYLKMVLQIMKQRDKLLHDINETIKLSNGKVIITLTGAFSTRSSDVRENITHHLQFFLIDSYSSTTVLHVSSALIIDHEFIHSDIDYNLAKVFRSLKQESIFPRKSWTGYEMFVDYYNLKITTNFD